MLKQGDYRKVFESPDGKRVLEDLERVTNFNRQSYDPNSDRNTCFNLGQREVILHIKRKMKADVEKPETVINKDVNNG